MSPLTGFTQTAVMIMSASTCHVTAPAFGEAGIRNGRPFTGNVVLNTSTPEPWASPASKAIACIIAPNESPNELDTCWPTNAGGIGGKRRGGGAPRGLGRG